MTSLPRILVALLGAAWLGVAGALAAPRLAAGTALAARELAAGPWDFSFRTLGANLGEGAATVTIAAAVVLAVWLVGGALLGWLGGLERRPRLKAAAAYAAGCGAAAALLGGLLLARLWYPWLLAAALLGPAAAAARDGLPRLRTALARLPRPGPWGTLAIVSFALWLPWMLAPEYHTDAWWHFLAAPRRWLAAHGFTIANASGPMHLPPVAESLNAFPVMLGLDAGPKWLDAAGGLLGIASALAVVRPAAPGWTWLLLSLCAGSPILTTGKNDGLAFGTVLAAWACGGRSTLAAGALFGIAAAVKPTSLVHGAWLLPLLLAGNSRRGRRAAVWATAAALAAGPWFLKEYLVTGDPVFPVLSGWIPSLVDGWDARNAGVWRLVCHIPPAGLARPAEVAGELARMLLPLAWILPFWLLRGARGSALRRNHAGRSGGRGDAAAALAVFAAWHLLMHNPHTTRHAFAIVALCLVLASAGGPAAFEAAGLPGRSGVALGVVLLVPAFLLRLGWSFHVPNPVPFALGAESRAGYVARAFTTLAELRGRFSSDPGPGRTTLLVGDPHEYAVAPPAIVGNGEASGATPLLWALVRASANEAALARKFRQLNIGRIVLNPVRAVYNAGFYAPFPWDSRQLRLWRSFFGRRFEREWTSPTADELHGAFCVYRARSFPVRGNSDGHSDGRLLHLPGTETPAEAAVEMLNRGNCPAAVGAMRALLASTGPVAEYQSILGFCARIAGDYDLAWRSYRPGFEEGLVNDENAFGFGVAALRTGRLEDAERGFLRAAELYPQAAGKARTALALVRLRRALVLVRTSPAAAAATLERAIAGAAAAPRPPDLESLVPLLHAALAVARLAQGRPADAIAERDLAASALPDIRRLTGEEIHAELEGFAREMTTRIGPPGEP